MLPIVRHKNESVSFGNTPDEEIDVIVTEARERFPNTEGAWEGLTLPL